MVQEIFLGLVIAAFVVFAMSLIGVSVWARSGKP